MWKYFLFFILEASPNLDKATCHFLYTRTENQIHLTMNVYNQIQFGIKQRYEFERCIFTLVTLDELILEKVRKLPKYICRSKQYIAFDRHSTSTSEWCRKIHFIRNMFSDDSNCNADIGLTAKLILNCRDFWSLQYLH